MSGIFNASIFNNAIFNTGESVADTGGGGGPKKRHKRPKNAIKVIRWSDLETREERAKALAQALAEASFKIRKAPEETDDPLIEEEDAIIHALILSRVLH